MLVLLSQENVIFKVYNKHTIPPAICFCGGYTVFTSYVCMFLLSVCLSVPYILSLSGRDWGMAAEGSNKHCLLTFLVTTVM